MRGQQGPWRGIDGLFDASAGPPWMDVASPKAARTCTRVTCGQALDQSVSVTRREYDSARPIRDKRLRVDDAVTTSRSRSTARGADGGHDKHSQLILIFRPERINTRAQCYVYMYIYEWYRKAKQMQICEFKWYRECSSKKRKAKKEK